MPHITLILCSLFSIALAFAVLIRPLFMMPQRSYFEASSDEQEFDESVSILEALNELEADFEMGKVSKEEYEALSFEYKKDYLALQEEQKP